MSFYDDPENYERLRGHWARDLERYREKKRQYEKTGQLDPKSVKHWGSAKVALRYMEYTMEYWERCLAGEKREAVSVDLSKRRAEDPILNGEESIEELDELAQRLQELPEVKHMTVEFKKTADGCSVFLFLNFSIGERAIIDDNGLDEIVYDKEPKYSAQEIADSQRAYDDELESMRLNDEYLPEDIQERRQKITEEMQRMRSETTNYTIIEYLSNPLVKEFKTRYQATQYIEKQKRILKKIQKDVYDHMHDAPVKIITKEE